MHKRPQGKTPHEMVRFGGLVWDNKRSHFPYVTCIHSSVLSAVACKALYDAIVQTTGQDAGDQSPNDSSDVALRGVTAEGDTGTTTPYSGSPLKSAVPSASTPSGVCTEGVNAALWVGVGSPTLSDGTHDDDSARAECTNIPRNVSARRLSTTSYCAIVLDFVDFFFFFFWGGGGGYVIMCCLMESRRC